MVAGGAVVVVVAGGQFIPPIVLASRVTAPVSANSRPSTTAPVFAVIETLAMMVPAMWELVPSVAELPTAQ